MYHDDDNEYHVNVDDHNGFFGLMPAVSDSMGIKLVTFYPDNGEKGLHTHHALILVFKPDTGEPQAVMDGRLITEMRTAAVSAAATKLLAAERTGRHCRGRARKAAAGDHHIAFVLHAPAVGCTRTHHHGDARHNCERRHAAL